MHRIASFGVAVVVLAFTALATRIYAANNFSQLSWEHTLVPIPILLGALGIGLVNLWVGLRPESKVARQVQAIVAATVLFGAAILVAGIVQFRFPDVLGSLIAAGGAVAIVRTTFWPARAAQQ